MKKAFVSILIGLACLLVLSGGFVAYAIYKSKSVDQVIATDILVSSEWTEITPDSSMKVKRQVQAIVFIIDDYKHDVFDKIWQIELPNGTVVKPEVQIFDGYGNVYDLQDGGRSNNDINFTPKSTAEFPKDRNYTKIRIRSDKSFQVSKVLWRNRNLK
jgi:hypothetical protein